MQTTTTFQPGDTVRVDIVEPGGFPARSAGSVLGIVIHAGGEYDVMIHPAEDLDEVDAILRRCDMRVSDLIEGPVHMLRNCQPEELTLVRGRSMAACS